MTFFYFIYTFKPVRLFYEPLVSSHYIYIGYIILSVIIKFEKGNIYEVLILKYII